MNSYSITTPIRRIPLHFTYGNDKFSGEILGKNVPNGKLYTCYFPVLGMFIIEARLDPVTRKYKWVDAPDRDFEHLIREIKQEIEHKLSAA